jgi:hypothetical protein
MLSVNAARPASAVTGQEPEAIDRLAGTIDAHISTPIAQATTVSLYDGRVSIGFVSYQEAGYEAIDRNPTEQEAIAALSGSVE